MKTLLSVAAFAMFLAVRPASAQQREIPKWEPVVEPFGAWMHVTFTDEAGFPHDEVCYYKSCGHASGAKQANLYALKQIDQRPINDGNLTHYESYLSAYVMTRDGKGWVVTKPGDSKFSAQPYYPSYFIAPNTKVLVMSPKGMAPDAAALKAERERIAKEKAEKERLAKEKAEKERLAKEKAAKEKERLAKEKAAKERLAKEKAEQERLAKEKAEQERLAKEKAERERQGNPALQPEGELTAFETMVLKADMTDEDKKKFDADYAAAVKNKDSKKEEYNKFIQAARAEVVKKVTAYVHPSWTPKNPNAPQVWDRFDPLEKAYIEQRLKEFGPDAVAIFEAQKKEAQAALDKKDAKKADAMVSLYRTMIKTDLNLYLGSGGTKLSAKEQLEKMQGLLGRLAGVTDIDQARKLLDDAIQGKGTDKPLNTGGGKDEQANQNLPTNEKKPDLANDPKDKGGKQKMGVPPPGADGGEDAAKEKTDWKLWTKRIGSTAAIGGMFAFIGAIFGGPLTILAFAAVGVAIGVLYNVAQDT